MIQSKLNDGRIDSLQNLYSALRDCAIINLKESMRCVVKNTGIVMEGNAFAAFIENGKLVVPIGSIVFGNYEIYSPLKPTTVELDIPSNEGAKFLIATLKYETSFSYPAFPDSTNVDSETTVNSLSVPTLEISLESSVGAPEDSARIGTLLFESGSAVFLDERRANAMSLLDPPSATADAPIVNIESTYIYNLPDLSSAPLSASYDTKHVASFLRIEWAIPRSIPELQYFTVELTPMHSGVEYLDGTTSSHYIPSPGELNTLGPSARAFINMRCVRGVNYKVRLYGYFARLALSKKLLGVTDVHAVDIDAVPGLLSVNLSDLVPTKKSFQINVDYTGLGKMQVFVQASTSVTPLIGKQSLYYEGPVAPVTYSAEVDSMVLVRIVNKYERVTYTSSPQLHEVISSGELADTEEQLVFIVPCVSDPGLATPELTVASFEAPYSFDITKGIFYQAWNRNYGPESYTAGKIEVEGSDAGIVYTFSYAAVVGEGMLGNVISTSTDTIAEGETVTIYARENGAGNIQPFYGAVALYIKKVIS